MRAGTAAARAIVASTAATAAGRLGGGVEARQRLSPVAERAVGIAIDGAVEGGTRRIGGAHEQPGGAEIDVGRGLGPARGRHRDRSDGGATRRRSAAATPAADVRATDAAAAGRDGGEGGDAPRHGRPALFPAVTMISTVASGTTSADWTTAPAGSPSGRTRASSPSTLAASPGSVT